MSHKLPQLGVHQRLALRFSAPMSKSMAEMLLAAFEGRSEDETLTLESREFGLWVVDEATGVRMFIGSTDRATEDVDH